MSRANQRLIGLSATSLRPGNSSGTVRRRSEQIGNEEPSNNLRRGHGDRLVRCLGVIGLVGGEDRLQHLLTRSTIENLELVSPISGIVVAERIRIPRTYRRSVSTDLPQNLRALGAGARPLPPGQQSTAVRRARQAPMSWSGPNVHCLSTR